LQDSRGSLKRLFTSRVDGQAFSRLALHTVGYKGPTLCLFKVALFRPYQRERN
jgi:hypothetical protein